MKYLYLFSFLWTLVDSIVILWGISRGMVLEDYVVLLVFLHSIMGALYRFGTRRIMNQDDPPHANREFFFICLMFFGPFGFFIHLFVSVVSHHSWKDLYSEYQDYIKVKWTEEEVASVNRDLELKKQMAKEPIIDSVRSPDEGIRRGAVDILSAILDERSIQALRSLSRDEIPSIRFTAASKLEQIEKRFLNDMKWYGDIIKIFGYDREIWMQYGNLILEYLHTGLADRDVMIMYARRSVRLFQGVLKEEEFHLSASIGLSRALSLAGKPVEAADLLYSEEYCHVGQAMDQLAESLFKARDFRRLRLLLDEVKSGERTEGPLLAEWFSFFKQQEDTTIKEESDAETR